MMQPKQLFKDIGTFFIKLLSIFSRLRAKSYDVGTSENCGGDIR